MSPNPKSPAGKKADASPHTGGPPPFRPKSGWRRQAKASHHRLNATKDAEDRPGHLQGEVAHGAPGHAIAQARLEPAQEPGAPDEGLGVLHRLAEHAAQPGSRCNPPMPRALRSDSASTARPKNVMARMRPAAMVNATKASPAPARAELRRKKASSDQTRFVKGSCRTWRDQFPGPERPVPRSWRATARAHGSAPGRCCPRAGPASRVPPVEHHGAQAQRSGAVGEHEHDPDCGRERVRTAGTTAATELAKMSSGAKRAMLVRDGVEQDGDQEGDAGEDRNGAGRVADHGADAQPEQGKEGEERSRQGHHPQHAGLARARPSGAPPESTA